MSSNYNNRWLWLVIVIAVLVGLGWWLTRDDKPDAPVDAPTPVPAVPPGEAERTGQQQPAAETADREARREELTRRMEAFVNARNRDFEFAGRIVDQDGTPLPAVAVEALIDVATTTTTSDRKVITVTTDGSGNFRLKDKGRSLRLAFRKSGYRFSQRDSFVLDRMSDTELERLNRSDNPLTFQAVRESSAPSEDVRIGHTYHKIIADGSYQSTDIENLRDLVQIRMRREPKGVDGESSSWSAALRIKNGELQETASTYLYEAPETGYTPQWSISYDKGADNWADRKTHTFFFRTDGGQTFGALTIEFRPYYRDQSNARIEYRVNATGSRNLLSVEDR